MENQSFPLRGSHSSLHPGDYDVDHISSLDVFTKDLNKALDGAFPQPTPVHPYTGVSALLLRWEDDDLDVEREITVLSQTLQDCLGFDVGEWHIPSQNSTRALQARLYDFQNLHQKEDELLIVYYGGHSDYDHRGRCIWKATINRYSPCLAWSSLQTLLETAVPHVLIVLDCCYAANAAKDLTDSNTTKEILAACSRESITSPVGDRSYTSALIDELRNIGSQAPSSQPVTVAMLHSRLMSIKWRLAYTPTYALLSENGGSSIVIQKMPESEKRAPSGGSISSAHSSQATNTPDRSDDAGPGHSLAQSSSQSSQPSETKVLIAVSFSEANSSLIVGDWKRWLTTDAPAGILRLDVGLESMYLSNSTLALFSIPVALWNRMPDRAAYRFVGFSKSDDFKRKFDLLGSQGLSS